MILIFVWAFLAIIVGVAANTRGRNFLVWFVLGVLISPLLAGLLLLALPKFSSGEIIVIESEVAREFRLIAHWLFRLSLVFIIASFLFMSIYYNGLGQPQFRLPLWLQSSGRE
jgi:uncharacterized membrane protein YhdT